MNGMKHILSGQVGEEQKLVNTTFHRRRPQAVFSWFSAANFVAPRLQKMPIEFYTFGKG